MATADQDFAYLAHDLSQLLWAIQGRARSLSLGLEGCAASDAAAIAEDAAAAAAMLADWRAVPGSGTADPAAVVEQAWRQSLGYARALSESPATYRWQGPGAAPRVAVSSTALRRILGNLLTNAIEAQPAGGAVACSATVTGRRLRLSVSDEGPGIPQSVRKTLFESGTSSRGTPGRGLGLAGARELAQTWGGDLTSGDAAIGAEFILTLPLAPASEVADAAGDRPREDRCIGGLQLFVVDDEPAVRDMLAELLAAEGHAPSICSGYDSALARFTAGRYDAALIDLGLSGRSGRDLAAALRERDPALALVLVTGWGREQELATCTPDLADLTAIKPLDLPQLRQLLASAAGLTATRRRAQAREA